MTTYTNNELYHHGIKALLKKNISKVGKTATLLNPFASYKTKEKAKSNYDKKNKEYKQAEREYAAALTKVNKPAHIIRTSAKEYVSAYIGGAAAVAFAAYASDPKGFKDAARKDAKNLMKTFGSAANKIFDKMYDTSVLDEGGNVIRRYTSKNSPIRDVTNALKR